MTPIDTSSFTNAKPFDVAELPSTQTERLRVIAKWFVGQHLVEAAAHLMCAADLIEQQSARLQELERDAARYRWLRVHGYKKQITYGYTALGLDSVIDAARAADADKQL
jgi:hypothetical protein